MPSGGDRRVPFWLLLGVTVVLDRITKVLAVDALSDYQRIQVVGDVAVLQLVYNRGAAFGLGGTHFGDYARWIFLVLAAVAVPVLHRLWRDAPLGDRVRQTALGFVAGGAVGNAIDRVLSARGVVDFIDIGVSSTLRWPTFNVADIAITCGAVVLAISLWREDAQQTATASSPPTP